MDLYQLRYFLEAARERHVTRAAGNLRLSPPAVSRAIALLERSVGKPLFHRAGRRLSLTRHGEALKARAERIFDLVEEARQELSGGGAADPAMLKVASREMITNYLLPEALLAFRRRHPATRFGLYELGARELDQALRKDLADFGFFYAALPDPAVESRRLGFLPSHIYAAPALLPGRRAPASFAKVRELPFVAPRYFGSDPADPSPDGYPDGDSPRRVQYEGEFLETHRRFVLDGVAAAVLPDFVMKEDWRRGRVLRLPGPTLGREIYFLKRRGRPLPPAVEDFVTAAARAVRRFGGR